MTNEQYQRTQEALVETKALLAAELKFRKDLQEKETVSFCEAHIAKLEDMLAKNEPFVTFVH